MIATASFLWPMFRHASTYSEGGDHMFNAWTLARNHHCILQEGCEKYSNGNIFFPNKDTMLYSETQLSAGILTLPLHVINPNPLFAVNIWHLMSALFSGFFMYLLARYLSKGNQAISILSGLIFEFAPTKISSMSHLQNLSIFYLPLIILMLLKYRDSGQRRYLGLFGLFSSLLFLASWYQMVFGLVVIVLFILFLVLQKTHRQKAKMLFFAVLVALLPTLPLAREYVRFSKETSAGFSINSQVEFSASINDYVLPYQETPLGALYYKLKPDAHRNSYNPDSFSYTGISLYIIALICLVLAVRKRKSQAYFAEHKLFIILLAITFVAGVIISLGPILKYGTHSSFPLQGVRVSIPAPYILVNTLLPQLSFIRAIGRASVIALFALCCALAIFGGYLQTIESRTKRIVLTSLVFVVTSLDLLPIRQLVRMPFIKMDPQRIGYTIPEVYRFVENNPQINNIVIVRTQKDYPNIGLPTARIEDVLWSGYHNRNIFNGYSGYEPPAYKAGLKDYTDLQIDDVTEMKSQNLQYYLVDTLLSQDSPDILKNTESILGKSVYSDSRYSLFKI